jgi:hypothetical protein
VLSLSSFVRRVWQAALNEINRMIDIRETVFVFISSSLLLPLTGSLPVLAFGNQIEFFFNNTFAKNELQLSGLL